MSIFHHYDLGYCETFVFDEFLINQINQGSIIEPKHAGVLEDIIKRHFNQAPMVYISNRILSYAVDPMTYIDTAKIKNLKAIAIVTQVSKFKKSAEFEGKFFKKPFEVFTTLSEAIGWANLILKTET